MRRGHRSPQYWDMIAKAKEEGFLVKSLKNGQIAVYPPDKSLPHYTTHPGETAIHPLRRFLDKSKNEMKKCEKPNDSVK